MCFSFILFWFHTHFGCCGFDSDSDSDSLFTKSLQWSLLVRMPDLWLKGCEFKSRQGWQENFLLQSQLWVLTLIWCPFHPCVTAVARKRPRYSAKGPGGRLHLNTHTPWTHGSQSGLTMPLSRQSVGIYQEMSLHATHRGTLSHNCLSLLSPCGLILA